MSNGFVLAAAIVTAFAASPALAVEVGSCEERNVALNQVISMRTYANGSVKLFEIDQVEPAASPSGIAVAIDRGQDLADAESFCRYVFGLSSVDLAHATANFDQSRGVLSIKLPVKSYVPDTDQFIGGTLTLEINKGAKAAAGLVAAQLR